MSVNLITGKMEKGLHPSKITVLRASKGLSQEEVSRKLGVSRASVSHIEIKTRHVTPIMAKQYASILNTSIEKIFSFNKEKGKFLAK